MMKTVWLSLALAASVCAAPGEFTVQLPSPAEVTAELELSSPGSDWAVAGREAALADVWVDGEIRQHVMLYAGAARYRYPVFFGELAAGAHTVRVTQNAKYSAAASKLEVHGVRFAQLRRGDAGYDVLAHAPLLYAREDTVGQFTDVPMLAYCERMKDAGKDVLQYTIIFSNEDGGTSTRALMARWGRTTDIEYIYRCTLNERGECSSAIIQTKDHKDVEFNGRRMGQHPILAPITRNNMVAGNVVTALRYQIPPIEMKTGAQPRETAMDLRPATWTVMAKELIRENKLRPFGKLEGEKISDPRNYLFLDVKLRLADGTMEFLARVKGERKWRSSTLGRPDYAIARDGWIRSTIELPPGTRLDDIEELGFFCHVATVPRGQPQPANGVCHVEDFGGAFLLGADGLPGARLKPRAVFTIPSGIVETVTPR